MARRINSLRQPNLTEWYNTNANWHTHAVLRSTSMYMSKHLNTKATALWWWSLNCVVTTLTAEAISLKSMPLTLLKTTSLTWQGNAHKLHRHNPQHRQSVHPQIHILSDPLEVHTHITQWKTPMPFLLLWGRLEERKRDLNFEYKYNLLQLSIISQKGSL